MYFRAPSILFEHTRAITSLFNEEKIFSEVKSACLLFISVSINTSCKHKHNHYILLMLTFFLIVFGISPLTDNKLRISLICLQHNEIKLEFELYLSGLEEEVFAVKERSSRHRKAAAGLMTHAFHQDSY